MITEFLFVFRQYILEILPALVVGFLLSGLIYEFVPKSWIEKGLGRKGMKAIIYATICGAILPICCLGALPVAISFYKKGARLGPVLSFLVATPATSISALLVTYRLLGLEFAVFIFFAVIFMGLVMGMVGNGLRISPGLNEEKTCPHCAEEQESCICNKRISERISSIFRFAFVDMVKEVGPEILLGIALAALIATTVPIGMLIREYLAGAWGYLFSLVFGLIMYICSTGTVPLVDAFIKQGMNIGAAMVLLLVGPVTSYGTILVLRKEFGIKFLLIYLGGISLLSLILGYTFYLIH